ncbi:tail fiber protein [Dechloromonas sp. ZY10]|uniref:phage tail protein n=1 Tax=Dechloromonas aquae TaxID=2664436 RepID=UPI0035281F44
MVNKLIRHTRQAAMVAGFMAIGGLVQEAQACPTTPFVGTVCTTSINYCPEGYLEAKGQAVSISNYEVLYAVIGATYGGTATTFNLPDIQSRAVVGIGSSPSAPSVVQGGIYGREAVSFTSAELPAHSHTSSYTQTATGTPQGTVSVSISSATGTTDTPSANANYLSNSTNVTVAGGKAAVYASTPTQTIALGGVTVSGSVGTVTVGGVGASTPISIVPPQLGLRQCIAYQGIYPVRP